MKFRSLLLICILCMVSFEAFAAGSIRPQTIKVNDLISIIAKSEIKPFVPKVPPKNEPTHASDSSKSGKRAEVEVFRISILEKNTETLLQECEQFYTPDALNGTDVPFALFNATLNEDILFYIYKFQGKVNLSWAARDAKGKFQKTGSQTLEAGAQWQKAKFQRLPNGLMSLSLLNYEQEAKTFEQESKNVFSFKTK